MYREPILLDSKTASGFFLKDVMYMADFIDAQTSDSSSAVNRWLSGCFEAQSHPTPPHSQESDQKHSYSTARQKKRRRMSSRSSSPRKRPRIEDDQILPDQSASVAAISELTDRTRLTHASYSHTSSPSRPTSPVRDLFNELRLSKPAIYCKRPKGILLPDSVLALRKHLTENFGSKVIPANLKVLLPSSVLG
jgi:hypothetical protein